jgi:methionine sulfoxide reductase heme-binding subunit
MDEMQIRMGIRATARISFALFLGAYLSDALYQLCPGSTTRWLKDNKGRFTLGFAASHLVHLGFILTLVAIFGARALIGRSWGVLVAFVTGFPFIYALAFATALRDREFWLTSPRFEAFAHCLLLTLFAFAFALHGITKPVFYAPFVFAAIAALVVRLASVATSRRVSAVTSNNRLN